MNRLKIAIVGLLTLVLIGASLPAGLAVVRGGSPPPRPGEFSDKKPLFRAMEKESGAAQRRYRQEIGAFRAARQQFRQAQDEWKAAKNEARAAAKDERASQFLEKTVSVLIRKIEHVKGWVSERKSLGDAEKQGIAAELDADIDWLNNQLSGTDGAGPEEIRGQAKELKKYWRDHRLLVKRVAGQTLSGRVLVLTEKTSDFADRIETGISARKAEGEDVLGLEALMTGAREKIALAEVKHDEARSKFQAISGDEDAKSLWREGHSLVKEAHKTLREAHADLVEIVRLLAAG